LFAPEQTPQEKVEACHQRCSRSRWL